MDLMDLAVKGSIVAAVAMVIGLIWIARRGHFEHETLSEEDAGHFVVGGALGPRPLLTRFKGRAWGASWGMVIATRDVITMLREGRYSEAAPWGRRNFRHDGGAVLLAAIARTRTGRIRIRGDRACGVLWVFHDAHGLASR